MTIELRIIDPKNTPPEDLKNAMRFLAACAGLVVNFGDGQTISADDRPDAGFDTEKIFAGKPGVVPAPDVPSIAGAGTSAIVPAGTPGISTGQAVPVPPVPTPAPPAGTVAPVAGNPVVTDSAGMPWDGRIHAETKTTIADGTWRKKRGVDAAIVAATEAELRQAMNIPNVPAAVPVPPPPNGLASQNAQAAASAGASGTTAESVAPPVANNKFPLLMAKVTSAMTAGTLTPEQITAAMASLGLPPTLPILVTRPDMIPTIAMLLFGSPEL